MTLIDDYLSEQITYEKKYGDNTIVLMQVGHFYEAYGVSNDEEKTNSANMTKLSDIMNIQMTRKNKNIPGNNRHNFVAPLGRKSADFQYVPPRGSCSQLRRPRTLKCLGK